MSSAMEKMFSKMMGAPADPANPGVSTIEKMIAKMLGFTPEQMHETLSGLQGLASGLSETLKRIEGKQDEIISNQRALEDKWDMTNRGLLHIRERLEHVGSNAPAERRGNRGTGNGSGSASGNGSAD